MKDKFIFIIFLSLIITTFFLLPKVVIIQKIFCQNQYGQCSESISQELEKIQGLNFYLAKQKTKQVLSENLLVKNYTIQFKIPSALEIHIVEKKPKFAIFYKNDSKFALINDVGEILHYSDSTTLPYLVVDQSTPNVVRQVDGSLVFALKIMFEVYTSYQTQKGYVSDDGLLIELNPGVKVLFPLEGDQKVLMGALSLVLNQLNSEKKDSKIESIDITEKVIDLRFKNPVIR